MSYLFRAGGHSEITAPRSFGALDEIAFEEEA